MGKVGIEPLPLAGAFALTSFRAADERGDFVKLLEDETFRRLGFEVRDMFFSSNKKGALRGLHYLLPNPQAKIVFCAKGRIFDAIVDLRRSSKTFGKCHTIELSEANGKGVYLPRGFAHGFLSLEEDSLVVYFGDAKYSPDSDKGVLYSDPQLKIKWPIAAKPIISKRDAALPLLADAETFE